jgi:hypothetical protein
LRRPTATDREGRLCNPYYRLKRYQTSPCRRRSKVWCELRMVRRCDSDGIAGGAAAHSLDSLSRLRKVALLQRVAFREENPERGQSLACCNDRRAAIWDWQADPATGVLDDDDLKSQADSVFG